MKRDQRCKPCGPIHEAADAAFTANNFQQAIALYSKVLKNDPNAIDALTRRGFSEMQLD